LERFPRKNHLNQVHGKLLNTMWHQYKTKEITG